jgi:hypothetical protein
LTDVVAVSGHSQHTVRKLIPRGVRHAASRWLAERAAQRLEAEFRQIATRTTPIIAGPWLGEVGFELLYWVPFLAWFAERFRIDPERMIIISRGGTGAWYSQFARHYSDAFEDSTPEAFRAEHDARVRHRGEQKQTELTEFERRLIDGTAGRSRITQWSLIHPSRMYALFNPFWWGHLPSAWVHRHSTYRRLRDDPFLAEPGLPSPPASYVAAKFYFNECFPANDRNRAFARDVLRRLSEHSPVVALSTGLNIDDHGGWRVDEFGIHHLPEGLEPARNLSVQSRIVAGARAFVGTYGGFSYLAPFHGVPAYSFYSHAGGFSPKHLTIAREAFAELGDTGVLSVTSIDEATPGLSRLLDANV